MRKCVICGKVNGPGPFFKVPTDERKLAQWSEKCRVELNSTAKVCSDHFLPNDFIVGSRRIKLMPSAIPSIGLDFSKEAKSVSNKQQMSKLVQLMECNPDIAKGVCSKSHAKERWESFSKILNSLGPPVKSCERWARVWVDLKSKTKKKLIKKRADIRANNENLSILNTLSPLDVAVDQILDFSSSIDILQEDEQSYVIEQNNDDSFSLSKVKEEFEIENEATVTSFEGSAPSSPSVKDHKSSFGNAHSQRNNSFPVSNVKQELEIENEATVSSFEGSAPSSPAFKRRKTSSSNVNSQCSTSFSASDVISNVKEKVDMDNESTVSSFEASSPSPPSVKRQKCSSRNANSQRMNLLLTHTKEERKFHKDICKRLEGIECAISMIRYEQKEHHQAIQNMKKEKLRLIKENNEKNEKYRAEKLQILQNLKK